MKKLMRYFVNKIIPIRYQVINNRKQPVSCGGVKIVEDIDCDYVPEGVKKGDLIAEGREKYYASFDFIPILVRENSYNNIICLAAKSI